MKERKGRGKENKEPNLATLTADLIKNNPQWGPILRVCIDRSKRTKNHFAGAWVFWGLKERGIKPPNNLRKLLSVGILVKTKSARTGKRAYYKMADTSAIDRVSRSLSL